jgi:hypothetical protein
MKNRGGQYTPIVFDGGEFFDHHFLHRVFKIKVNKKDFITVLWKE